MENKVIYTLTELTELLGLSRHFILTMRKNGSFPEPIKTGTRTLYWRKADIDKFLHQES